MKVSVFSYGDMSVGIFPIETYLNLGFDFEDEERERIREEIREFFGKLHDVGKTEVVFEDECPDCHRKLIGNTCMTDGCPSNNITFRNMEVEHETR